MLLILGFAKAIERGKNENWTKLDFPHERGKYENLKKPEIKKYIEEQLEKISSEKIADATEVMKYLTSVMRREKTENIVVTLTKEKTKYVKDENGTPRKQTVKEEVAQIVEIPSKLTDANKAAELIGKRYGIFTEKMNVTGAIPVVISGDDELED